MIVTLHPTGWACIYQQAHALLAARLAAHWHPARRPVPARWAETLAAIAQHDDGQDPWRGDNGITPAGAPAPFTLVPFSLEQARRVVAQARFQGRWRWWLTSLHISNLYEPLRGKHGAETDAFLDEQRATQEACRRGLRIKKADAQAAYALFQWADRLSLILCLGELPADERYLDIAPGPDGTRYRCCHPGLGAGGELVQTTDPIAVVVEPWPFDADEFEVSVEVTHLTQLAFADDAELAKALRVGEVRERVWRICRAARR